VLPVRLWQARQWQSETLVGSPSQLTVSWPQSHVDGGSFNLACIVDGNVTETGGSLMRRAGTEGEVARLRDLNIPLHGRRAEQAQNNPSPLEIGGATSSGCPGNTVGGNPQVQNNTANVSVDYNTVGGNLQVDNDSAMTDVSGNSVGKNLECQNDNVVTYVTSNMVKGNNQGQCAARP
jgi:hypothetical protein